MTFDLAMIILLGSLGGLGVVFWFLEKWWAVGLCVAGVLVTLGILGGVVG